LTLVGTVADMNHGGLDAHGVRQSFLVRPRGDALEPGG
jgi:hypothetical protein